MSYIDEFAQRLCDLKTEIFIVTKLRKKIKQIAKRKCAEKFCDRRRGERVGRVFKAKLMKN